MIQMKTAALYSDISPGWKHEGLMLLSDVMRDKYVQFIHIFDNRNMTVMESIDQNTDKNNESFNYNQ